MRSLCKFFIGAAVGKSQGEAGAAFLVVCVCARVFELSNSKAALFSPWKEAELPGRYRLCDFLSIAIIDIAKTLLWKK